MNGARIELDLPNGVVMVGSDIHIWPNEYSTAQRAFEYMLYKLHPAAVILNGDVIDAATISSFPPMGWETQPLLAEELESAKVYSDRLIVATPTKRHLWTLGNHDARVEKRLAQRAPEFKNIPGIHLKDHFPDWEPCWTVSINDRPGLIPCEIKHRFKGGTHAAYNNALHAGTHIITGHLHSAKVCPITDNRGTRYGVDGGMMARVGGPQFTYTEDNPRDWRSGFVVLTFKDGRLMLPELCLVWDEEAGIVEFRGELIHV